MIGHVVAQIVQALQQRLRSGVVTLIPKLSILIVSQQQTMGGGPYGHVKMKEKLATNESRRQDWMA